MKVMVVLGHPNTESFNHAIAAAAVQALRANGHEVFYHDLYAEGFDPVLTQAEYAETEVTDPVIKAQCEEAAGADGFVIVHPKLVGPASGHHEGLGGPGAPLRGGLRVRAE